MGATAEALVAETHVEAVHDQRDWIDATRTSSGRFGRGRYTAKRMGKFDRFIVPGTVVACMLAMFFVTNAWIKRPSDALQWKVTLGPPNMTRPSHEYRLSFTPRNVLSGHAIKGLIPLSSSRRCPARVQCVDVTITNASLTYLDRRVALRWPDGSYKLLYTFPRPDDYAIFVEMQPREGGYEAKRNPPTGFLHIGACRSRACQPHRATLRGQEAARGQSVGGLTVVLGAPVGAIQSDRPAQLGLVYLRGGRSALDVTAPQGTDYDAVAISMDTYHFVRLHVDKSGSGRGVIAYAGIFGAASIYRVWAPVPNRRARAQASFVLDVDPPPKPTPTGQ